MGETDNKSAAAWFDFRISVSTLLTVAGAAVAVVTSYSRLEGRVDILQRLLLEQSEQMETLRKETERQDVAASERRAINDRINRLERSVDSLK